MFRMTLNFEEREEKAKDKQEGHETSREYDFGEGCTVGIEIL